MSWEEICFEVSIGLEGVERRMNAERHTLTFGKGLLSVGNDSMRDLRTLQHDNMPIRFANHTHYSLEDNTENVLNLLVRVVYLSIIGNVQSNDF